MRFLNTEVNPTSLLSAVMATKIGGDIISSLVGNDLSSSVDGKMVEGEMVYSSIGSVIINQHPAAQISSDDPSAVTEENVLQTFEEVLFDTIGRAVVHLQRNNKQFVPRVNTPLAAYLMPYTSLKQESFSIGSILNDKFFQNNLNEIVEGGLKGIGSLISVCRNEAIPVIRDVLADADKVAKSRQREIVFPFTIVKNELPALWKDTSFLASLDKSEWKSNTANTVVPLMGMNVPGIELPQMLLTGVKHLDDIITDTLINNVEDIKFVWGCLSRQGNQIYSQLLVNDSEGVINGDNRRYYLTIAYLLARRVLAVGADSFNVKEPILAKEYFTGLVRGLGQSILRNIDLYESIGRNNFVVDRTFVKDEITQVVVHADNYNKWLLSNEANSPEILFSSVDSLGTRIMMDVLNEKRVSLAANWNRLYAICENKRIQREREVVSYSANSAIQRFLMNGFPVPEGITAEHHADHINRLRKRVPDILGEMSYDTTSDLPVVVRDLVCKVIYGNTDILTFLSIYDRLGAQYPQHDPRTIATIATIEYVGKWVAKQLIVVSQ